MYSTYRAFGRAPSRSLRRLLSTSSNIPMYDVVVHGGGIVGALFAADLLQRTQGQIKLCLIDGAPKRRPLDPQAPPDIRTYALSPSSIHALQKLGMESLSCNRVYTMYTIHTPIERSFKPITICINRCLVVYRPSVSAIYRHAGLGGQRTRAAEVPGKRDGQGRAGAHM